MNTPPKKEIIYRKALQGDRAFMSEILLLAAQASGVVLALADLPLHPDTYAYVEGYPQKTDVGVLAQTADGQPVGAAWVRVLPTDAHAIHEVLPELTMGVLPAFQRQVIGAQLLEELYRAATEAGLKKLALGVHQENSPAIGLYLQQTWKKDGFYKEYVMMSKELNA